MIFYILLIFGLILFPSDFFLRKKTNSEWLCRNETNAVKGIFMLLILASHFSFYVPSYKAPVDVAYSKIRFYLLQLVVACFFFYSGYGIMEQMKKRGKEYVRAFPGSRILKVWTVWLFSELIFWIADVVLLKEKYSLKDILLSCLAWESLGNDNWYIFVILVLYLLSYIVFLLREDGAFSTILITALSFAFILVLKLCNRPEYWYDVIICYPMGMWVSEYRQKIEKYVLNFQTGYLLLVVAVLCFSVLHRYWEQTIILYELTGAVFIIIVLLLTTKIKLNNRFLIYCGEHLSSIFLTHRLPLALLQNTCLSRNRYVFFVSFLVSAFVVAFLFERAYKYLKYWIRLSLKKGIRA